jgi:hypothetical protein
MSYGNSTSTHNKSWNEKGQRMKRRMTLSWWEISSSKVLGVTLIFGMLSAHTHTAKFNFLCRCKVCTMEWKLLRTRNWKWKEEIIWSMAWRANVNAEIAVNTWNEKMQFITELHSRSRSAHTIKLIIRLHHIIIKHVEITNT